MVQMCGLVLDSPIKKFEAWHYALVIIDRLANNYQDQILSFYNPKLVNLMFLLMQDETLNEQAIKTISCLLLSSNDQVLDSIIE